MILDDENINIKRIYNVIWLDEKMFPVWAFPKPIFVRNEKIKSDK